MARRDLVAEVLDGELYPLERSPQGNAVGLQASGFTAAELRAVERGSALALLPSLV